MAAPKPGDLVIDESYLGIKCSSCGEFVPLQPNPMGFVGLRGKGTQNIGCPFCGTSDEYPISAIEAQVLKKMPPTPH
jgi:hypothetical protein